MALHRLSIDDFYTDTYTLFGIHCNLEDYRIAYHLNKFLNLGLKRNPTDIDFEYTMASYAIFEWEDVKQHTTWSLISNVCRKEEDALTSTGTLFNQQGKVIKTHNLIPEYRQVNYLLKIDNGGNPVNEKPILNKIIGIPHIIAAYSINVSTLKTKENLIFK